MEEIYSGYSYKGYVYRPSFDNQDDNFVTFHFVETLGDGGRGIYMNYSSHLAPFEKEFRDWVDAGCPKTKIKRSRGH